MQAGCPTPEALQQACRLWYWNAMWKHVVSIWTPDQRQRSSVLQPLICHDNLVSASVIRSKHLQAQSLGWKHKVMLEGVSIRQNCSLFVNKMCCVQGIWQLSAFVAYPPPNPVRSHVVCHLAVATEI